MTEFCDVCAEHAPGDGWRLCHRCVRELDDTLAAIARAYGRLDPQPGARPAVGRGAPGYRSTPPANLDVLVLTDPRTRMTAEDRWVAATVNVLGGWADALGIVAAPEVPAIVGQLRGRLDALAGAEWAADAFASLSAHHRELLRVLGDLEPSVTIGPCPVLVAADDGEAARPCGGRIRAQAFGKTAVCGRCGSVWRGLVEWRDLGRTLGPAELDAAELARYFGHSTPSTVRTWASRYCWPRRRVGGRTVYPLHAALATWARINGAEAAADDQRSA